MKNTFARGGIEFLAVLLGLSGSLSIDSIVKERESKEQNIKILKRLYNNLVADSLDGSWNKNAYKRAIEGSENVIEWCDNNPTFKNVDNNFEKDLSAMLVGIFFVNNEEEYIALKNSGRMDLISNEELVVKLHEYYTNLRFVKQLDQMQINIIYDDIMPFLENHADEYSYNKNIPESKVFGNIPKINLISMPDTKKLRFRASQMLFYQKFSYSRYGSTVSGVTEIRQLLRKELEL